MANNKNISNSKDTFFSKNPSSPFGAGQKNPSPSQPSQPSRNPNERSSDPRKQRDAGR